MKPKAIEIIFCNRAYAHDWYTHFMRQNRKYEQILTAIIDEISYSNGAEIHQCNVEFRLGSKIPFRIIPSRGQMLSRNGAGIRHVKFTESKSTAVIWEKIGELIIVTFDDHSPIAYHRAISHLRDMRLGKPILPPRPARTRTKVIKKLRQFKRDRFVPGWGKYIHPRHRYYE